MAEQDPKDSLEAATQATRGLQGLSTELTARIPQLLEAMRSVGTGLELHSTLDRICETAAELTHADYAAIGVAEEGARGSPTSSHTGCRQRWKPPSGTGPTGTGGFSVHCSTTRPP